MLTDTPSKTGAAEIRQLSSAHLFALSVSLPGVPSATSLHTVTNKMLTDAVPEIDVYVLYTTHSFVTM
jgi:hypothetical protein